MGSLAEIQSVIKGSDVARQNRFDAMITGPAGAGSPDYATMMLVESVEFPGQTIRTTPDLLRFGPQREVGQAAMYADSMTMTFICRPGLPEKMYFEKWHAQIFNPDTWEINFYKNYVGGIQLHQLDRKDGKRYSIEVFEAYPKTIVAQTYNQSSNDSYQTLSVEFAFRYWTSKAGAGGAGGAVGSIGASLGGLGGGGFGSLIAGAGMAALTGGSAGLKSFAAGKIGAALGAKGLVQGLMSGANKKVMAKDMLLGALSRGVVTPSPSGMIQGAMNADYSKMGIAGTALRTLG